MVYLWKVTAKTNIYNQIVAGMWVEIVKTGTNAPPSQKETANAFNEKYKTTVPECNCGEHCFDKVLINNNTNEDLDNIPKGIRFSNNYD